MARYTSTVFEILQENATSTERISNLTDMTNISSRTLFLDAPLNVLSENARANFITQFTLHYMRDEIGMETLTLWRLALAEKLYNNAAYINAIYDNLYRQAYTEYEKTLNQSNGTRTKVGTAKDVRTDDITTTTDQTNTNVTNGERKNTGTQSTDAVNSATQTNDLTGTLTQTGTERSAKIGTDTATDTGTQQNTNNLTDTQSYNSTSTETRNMTDTTNYGGIMQDLKNTKQTDKNIKLYDTVTEKSFDNRIHEKSYDGKTIDDTSAQMDNNSMGLTFDTPQGSLDDLRNPGGVPGSGTGQSAVGKGIAYATGQDYNYFSAAQEQDGTTWNTGHNERSYDDYKETDEDSGKEIVTEKNSIDGTTHKDEHESLTKYEANTITVNGNTLNGDVNLKSGSDSLSMTGTDANAKTGSDTLTKTGSTTRTDNLTHEVLYDTEVTDTKNLTTTDRKTGTVNDTAINHNTVTDNLNETTNNTAVNTGNSNVKSTGSVTNENEHNDTDVNNDNSNGERFKVDFLAFCMKPNLMDKVWQVFDDLFMWLYN